MRCNAFAADIGHDAFMPDCDSVPIQTVRVYLKRLPSGALRLTVLTPSLPDPLFRMYPADVGEAEAVARAVGRALSLSAQEQSNQKDCDAKPEFHGLALASHEVSIKNHQPDCEAEPITPCGVDDAGICVDANHRQQECSPCLAPQNVAPYPTQHLRPQVVRVTWQGLLG